jgi:hypothetical protein
MLIFLLGLETALQRSNENINSQEYLNKLRVSGWNSDFVVDKALQTTTLMTTWFSSDIGIYIHSFIPDDTVHEFQLLDCTMILASTVKVVEAVVLYRLGSTVLWWSSIIGWAVCFLIACALQAFNLGRDIPRNIRRVRDHLLADLPSYNRPGGDSKKVILDQPVSVREHVAWKVAWAIAALSNAVSLSVTFYALTNSLESITKVVYAWVVFQICWLLLRTIAYYTIPDSIATNTVSLNTETWDVSSHLSRLRVLRLLLAASIQQAQEHVRAFSAYTEDLVSLTSPDNLTSVLRQANWRIFASLAPETTTCLDKVRIQAVIGEELLRTVVWVTGTKVNNEDMYDAVAALFESPVSGKYLVPGARVMSGAIIRPTNEDQEATTPSFDARGSVNKSKTAFWVYWFPVENTNDHTRPSWLEIMCEPFSVLGALRGYRIRSYEELDRRLAAGVLNIGLKGILDLEKVIEVSSVSTNALLHMMNPA